MMNNIFRAPRGNKITLRMFISPRNQQQANPGGNANGLRDLNERNLAVDEQRTGDKRFIAREVNITGRLMSSLKRNNAFLLYEEVHHYNPL